MKKNKITDSRYRVRKIGQDQFVVEKLDGGNWTKHGSTYTSRAAARAAMRNAVGNSADAGKVDRLSDDLSSAHSSALETDKKITEITTDIANLEKSDASQNTRIVALGKQISANDAVDADQAAELATVSAVAALLGKRLRALVRVLSVGQLPLPSDIEPAEQGGSFVQLSTEARAIVFQGKQVIALRAADVLRELRHARLIPISFRPTIVSSTGARSGASASGTNPLSYFGVTGASFGGIENTSRSFIGSYGWVPLTDGTTGWDWSTDACSLVVPTGGFLGLEVPSKATAGVMPDGALGSDGAMRTFINAADGVERGLWTIKADDSPGVDIVSIEPFDAAYAATITGGATGDNGRVYALLGTEITALRAPSYESVIQGLVSVAIEAYGGELFGTILAEFASVLTSFGGLVTESNDGAALWARAISSVLPTNSINSAA